MVQMTRERIRKSHERNIIIDRRMEIDFLDHRFY